MQNTTNYGFKKPEENEYFDQQAHANYNIDQIDSALTPTTDPALAPANNGPGKLVQWVGWIANRIKAITGKTNWYDTPDITLAVAKNHIDAAAPHTGHETPAGAQIKANTAESNAETFASELIGSLSALVTTAKGSLVSAINEIFNSLAAHKTDNVTQLASKATTANYTATITATWFGASAPFTQTVTVTGILATDVPIIFPVFSTDNATAILQQAAWDSIGKIVTGVDSITVTCFTVKPVTAINIQLKVVR